MHIKNLLIKYCYNFNCKLLKHSFNQITINKVLDNNSSNNINYLNNCLYLPTKSTGTKSTGTKSNNKTYNKTFITYNHLKGSKRAFNCNLYKSIKVIRFYLIAMLKRFKSGIRQKYINKIIRLRIYKWGLIKIMLLTSNNKIIEKIILISINKIILKMLLISSFNWSDVKVELYLTNLLKIEACVRFLTQMNPISDWSKISIWGNVRRFLTKINPISEWSISPKFEQCLRF